MTQSGVQQILIVDELRLLTDSLTRQIEQEPDLQVVGIAADSESGLLKAFELKPDIVVIDVSVTGRGCLDFISRLVAAHSEIRVLLLAGNFYSILLDQALRFGSVRGCFDKRDSVEQLIEALRRISAGDFYYSASFSPRLQFDEKEERYRIVGEISGNSLTTGQLEILKYLAAGMSVKEIATVMGRTEKAIESHKYRIMNRLNIRDRVVLARFAIREGLVPP